MNRPLVSVITSNYNCAGYLPGCVKSVLNQTIDSWEHIIIDCGSTDNSRETLKSLMHPCLRVIHEDFCAVARARNIAIQKAEGEFCAILDADDLALPNRLQLQTELLQKNPDLVAVGGGFKMVFLQDPSRKQTGSRKIKKLHYPCRHNELMLFLRALLTPIGHSIFTFRRSVFQEIGGYREAMEKSEDYDLILRFGLHGKLASVPEQVGIIHYGRDCSHTSRIRPQGRDALYYTVSSLLLNISCLNGLKCTQQEIEKWLDSIGEQGINALNGLWLWNVLIKSGIHLSFASLVYFLGGLKRCLPSVIACRRQPWLSSGSSPENILKECIVSAQNR
ncbi:MAG: glycosyltransferase [Candidatus Wallbacteria bacterium]|nr:glycosyltransferase [Candidatus Wallbacteria bacterium]